MVAVVVGVYDPGQGCRSDERRPQPCFGGGHFRPEAGIDQPGMRPLHQHHVPAGKATLGKLQPRRQFHATILLPRSWTVASTPPARSNPAAQILAKRGYEIKELCPATPLQA